MDYRKIYISIIRNSIKNKKERGVKKKEGNYYEKHHILPKSLFPLWAKRKGNITLLTAREHYICHQLLDKIYPGIGMFMSLWWLANDGQNNYCVRNSKEYERLKKGFSKSRLKENRDPDRLKRASEKIRNWYIENDNPNLGKKYYNDGITNIYTKGGCPNGFTLGRLITKEHRKNLIIRAKNREYKRGKEHHLYGNNPPEDVRQKISNALKGHAMPDSVKEALLKANKGKPHSEEHKKKINNALKGQTCVNKGKKWFTNGKEDVMRYECPIEYTQGRSKNKKRSK